MSCRLYDDDVLFALPTRFWQKRSAGVAGATRNVILLHFYGPRGTMRIRTIFTRRDGNSDFRKKNRRWDNPPPGLALARQ